MFSTEDNIHKQVDQIYYLRHQKKWSMARIINKHPEFYDKYPSIFNSVMDSKIDLQRVHTLIASFFQAKKSNTVKQEGIKLQKQLAEEYIIPILSEADALKMMETITNFEATESLEKHETKEDTVL